MMPNIREAHSVQLEKSQVTIFSLKSVYGEMFLSTHLLAFQV